MFLSPVKTIICIGSGPSLTLSDCDIAYQSGSVTIAVNNAYERMPGCKFIFSGDYQWWRKNKEVIEWHNGLITTCKYAAKAYGIYLFQQVYSSPYSSSGEKALDFALSLSPQNIILLGYDFSLQHGVHFHGSHKDMPNPNVYDMLRFKKSIEKMPVNLTTKIINCSRDTKLTHFKRMILEDALSEIN